LRLLREASMSHKSQSKMGWEDGRGGKVPWHLGMWDRTFVMMPTGLHMSGGTPK